MLLVAGALALPAGAAARSDLVVSSVSNPPATLPLGDGFNATETVRNQARALRVRRGKLSKKAFARKKRKALLAQTAGASTTRFYLSADRVLGGGDFSFAAVRGAPSLRPGAGSGRTTRLAVPLTAPVGSFYLLVCADDLKRVVESSESNNCRASATRINVAPALTSEELIARALARGEISEETALTYGVYLDFEDARLPSAFHGIDEEPEDHSTALEEAERKWDTLSAATREKLDPFFIPPIYHGSWRDPVASSSIALRADPPADPPGSDICNELHPAPDTATWSTMDAHGGDVRIWWANSIYPGDQAKAQAIATAIDSTIWTKVTNLWGKAPLPDSGGQPGVYCRGNTDGLDIILIDRGSPGEVKRYFPKRCGQASPGFMMLNHALTGNKLLGVLAHEFTHTIQIADDWGEACPKAAMLAEALGKWTEDYVYPSNNTEQDTWQVTQDSGAQLTQSYPRLFLRNTAEPYMFWSDFIFRYPAYMYPFFLNRAYSDISVRTLWDEFKTRTTLNAIKAAADDDGGLDEVWPEFALYNWNREPFTEYSQWDGISHQPPIAQEFGYGEIEPVDTRSELELPTDVKPLSAKYYRYRFTDSVRQIDILNTLVGIPGANVHAMVHLKDGTWKQRPGAPGGGNQPALKLTDESKKTFCRDKPDEDVDELVLVISNSNATESGSLTEKPKLITRSVCPKSFTGTYSGTTTQSAPYPATINYHGNLNLDPCTDPMNCDPDAEWQIRSTSTLTIESISGTSGDCTLSAAAQTVPLLGGNGGPPGLEVIPPNEYYIHIGITYDDRTVLVDFQGPPAECPGPVEVPLSAFFVWMVYNNNEPIVPPPDGSIARNNVHLTGDPFRDQTVSFSLTPVAAP